ncbi:CDP-alcohol phosphatidyltransferase family protein [Adlercreutzia aquisgranensis]|uniref:CDP-alcohol phosphatidyltransferase family protein n=1 Tax=Adlercreutzia aquisgranensis TaxID=2941323 RepID=UPI002040BAC6|nr:CDP-alcohol phosphatidyltransferase family protein [Adlercreutzia aquisgranensis]
MELQGQTEDTTDGNEVVDRVFTAANVISFVRLCMVPLFLVLLLQGHGIAATVVFALAASTDFLDGQVARRTHTVSRLGRLLDPAVDRLLMIAGVVGLLIVGRLPLWIVLLVLGRDLALLVGAAYCLRRWGARVDVIFAGKVCTTLLFVGFAGLLLNMPLLPGLGLVDASWLPGFGVQSVSWGIWFIYAGLVLGVATTAYYVRAMLRAIAQAKSRPSEERHG